VKRETEREKRKRREWGRQWERREEKRREASGVNKQLNLFSFCSFRMQLL
jgi:hypothetical protein